MFELHNSRVDLHLAETCEEIIDDSALYWTAATNSSPQGFLLGSVLFNIFMNDLDNGTDMLLIKIEDNTQLEHTDNIEYDKMRLLICAGWKLGWKGTRCL